MLDIQTLIAQNFEQNISYLQKKQPLLYDKISEYESAVERGLYKEKYELIYENNNFDVHEYSSNNKLYNLQTTEYVTLATQSINLDSQTDCFSTFNIENEPLFSNIDKKELQGTQLLKLYKFLFFGTGLGLHISAITEKFSLKSIFIIEDDLELFRLSLFTTNYAHLSEKCELFFSVFEETQEFLLTSESFLNSLHQYNATLKFFTMLNHSNAKIKEFQLALSTQPHLTFLHQDLFKQLLQPLANLKSGYKFLTKESSLNTSISPFILIGAGPSLEAQIASLQNTQENFIIVALSATLSYLEANNIRVDIVVHLDAFEAAFVHFEKIKEKSYFANSLAFFSAKTPKKVLDYFEKENIYLFEDTTSYKKDSLKPSSPCVGSLAYQILLLLKVPTLYLLGIDLSIDSKSGATHSQSHNYTQTLDTSSRVSTDEDVKYKESLFEFPANRGGVTLTTAHFLNSIEAINLSTKYLKSSEVYNLSSGAKFEKIDAIEFPKASTTQQIESLFLNGSFFTQKDMTSLKKSLTSLEKSLPSLTSETFSQEQLLHIDTHFSQEQLLQKYPIYKVINLYLRTTIPSLFNIYNRTSNQNRELHSLQLLLLKKIQEKVLTYINTVKEVL